MDNICKGIEIRQNNKRKKLTTIALNRFFSVSTNQSKGDFRSVYPRFQGENFQKNQRLVDSLRAIATRKGCTLAQLAVAWVLSRGDDIVPLVGARTTKRLQEALGGTSVSLSSGDLVEIERAVPRGAVAGERYPVEQMAWLDSERIS